MAATALRSEDRQCRSKRQQTKREAKRAIRLMEQHAGRMVAYRCGWCGWWHVGHPLGKTRRS